jgi:D-ribose pyranase
MKTRGVINSRVAHVVAALGHGDAICVADAGLPISGATMRIDLAVMRGIPSFWDVVDNILEELEVEGVIIAEEMTQDPELYKKLLERFHKREITSVAHEEFTKLVPLTKATIRTGEFTPFANIILQSGVPF